MILLQCFVKKKKNTCGIYYMFDLQREMNYETP